MADPFTTIGTAAALCRDTKTVDTNVEKLAEEVKSLGNECDLVHAELNEVVNASKAGTSSPYDADGRLWRCLDTKVKQCSHTIDELNEFVQEVSKEASGFVGQAQRQMKLNKGKDKISRIRVQVQTNTDGLRTALLLINITVAHIAPGHANRQLSEKLDALQEMIERLQKATDANPQSPTSDADATLVQCAREVMVKGTTMYEASLADQSIIGGQGAANCNIRVAQWVGTLEAWRREEQTVDVSGLAAALPSVSAGEDVRTPVTGNTSTPHDVAEREDVSEVADHDSDDELAIDLAKAALDSGTEVFHASEWQEAGSILQEAVRLLQQLPKRQRAFCSNFDLQYMLAVCAYHTQEPENAEAALTSLFQHATESEEQIRCICDAAHLLSQLYVRMNRLDLAESKCVRALQARRRLLGKENSASLESMALMARIYQRQQKCPLAKVYLAMIPEAQKTSVLESIDASLGSGTRTLNESLQRAPTAQQGQSLAKNTTQNDLSPAVPGAASETEFAEGFRSAPARSQSSDDQQASRTPRDTAPEIVSLNQGALNIATRSRSLSFLGSSPGSFMPYDTRDIPPAMLRKEAADGVLRSIPIRQLRCPSEVQQRHLHDAGRLSPLHCAALFGDLEMADEVLNAGAELEMVCTRRGYMKLTPLSCAIGTRRIAMIDFLASKGALFGPELIGNVKGIPSRDLPPGALLEPDWLLFGEPPPPEDVEAALLKLLSLGCDVNRVWTTAGETFLSQAIAIPSRHAGLRLQLVAFLINKGANVLHARGYDQCAALVAVSKHAANVIPLLLQYERSTQLGRRNDVLYDAVQKVISEPETDLEVVRALLKAGADANVRYEHFTPRRFWLEKRDELRIWEIACRSDRGDLMKLLRETGKLMEDAQSKRQT